MSLKAGFVAVASWLGLISAQVNAPPPEMDDENEDEALDEDGSEENGEDAAPSADALETQAARLLVQAEQAAAATRLLLEQVLAERDAAARGVEAAAALALTAQLPAALAASEAVFARPQDIEAAETLRGNARRTARALDALVRAPEGEWTAAKAVAAEALRVASEALRALADSVASERRGRQARLEALNEAAKTLENPLPAATLALVKPGHRYRKDLVAQQAAMTKTLAELRDAAEMATIATFAASCAVADGAIEEIRRQVALVAGAAESAKNQKAEQQRKAEIEALRWTRGKLDRGELDVLADPKPGEAVAVAFKAYAPAFATLEKAGGEAFEPARRAAAAAYDALERAFAAALVARDAEIRMRRAAHADLKQRAGAIAANPAPLEGTPESTTLSDARRACAAAVNDLDLPKIMGGRSDIFIAAQAAAEQALQSSARAAQDSSDAAQRRAADFLVLSAAFNADILAATADAPNGPSAALKDPIAAAVRARGQKDLSALRGVDPIADGAVAAAFAAWRPTVRALASKLNAVDAANYAAVAANVEIQAAAKALLDQIAAAGVGPAAEGLAETLKAAVAAIAQRYAAIDALQATYDEILAHDGYVVAWRADIEKYTAVKGARNGLNRGRLTVRTTEAKDALDLILGRCERRAFLAQASADYQASAEGQFLAFVQVNNPTAIANEMARLVGTGDATPGAIYRAYVSNHDDAGAGEFSIEARVDIGGAHGVVTHAHCAADGTPKAGFACHFKLANAKYGKTAYAFTAASRAALVPGGPAIMAARAAAWSGWRPDWV